MGQQILIDASEPEKINKDIDVCTQYCKLESILCTIFEKLPPVTPNISLLKDLGLEESLES